MPKPFMQSILKSGRRLEPEAMSSAEEIDAYDRLSLKYLSIVHNGFIETIINSSAESGRFLEVGCGTARISVGVAKFTENVEITAVDISDNMLAVARGIARKEKVDHKIRFVLADAKTLPFQGRSFDTVYCHNMLHHLTDPMPVLEEMRRVVKEKGAFLVRDLLRKSLITACMHVGFFGLRYNRLMRKEYFDSILAAYSKQELRTLMARLKLPECRYTRQFITHHGIEKTSENMRVSRVSISSSPGKKILKGLYSSL